MTTSNTSIKAPAASPVVEKPRVSNPPVMKARSRGHVSEVLDGLAEAYKADHPDKEVAFVYDPTNNPGLSKRMRRTAQGYVEVRADDMKKDNPFGSKEGAVRVGDLVLMAIDKTQHAQLRKDIDDLAKAEMERVKPSFDSTVAEIAVQGNTGTHTGRPIGSLSMEIQEREVNIDQRKE
jgi:hypothetical protein